MPTKKQIQDWVNTLRPFFAKKHIPLSHCELADLGAIIEKRRSLHQVVQESTRAKPDKQKFAQSFGHPSLEKLRDQITVHGDLESYAATRAINELFKNWSSALQKGHPLASLTGDIDGVIHRLSEFKATTSQLALQDQFNETGELPSLIRGRVRVSWTNLNEGTNGDYDEGDPEDKNLLRFDLHIHHEGEWREVPNGSFCTRMPADTEVGMLKKALVHIMDQVFTGVTTSGSAKHACEELSWIGPKFFDEHALQQALSQPPVARTLGENPNATTTEVELAVAPNPEKGEDTERDFYAYGDILRGAQVRIRATSVQAAIERAENGEFDEIMDEQTSDKTAGFSWNNDPLLDENDNEVSP